MEAARCEIKDICSVQIQLISGCGAQDVAHLTDSDACTGSSKEHVGNGHLKHDEYSAASAAPGHALANGIAKPKPKPKAPKVKQPKKPTPAQAAEALTLAKVRKVHQISSTKVHHIKKFAPIGVPIDRHLFFPV